MAEQTAVWLIETLNRGGTENVMLRLLPHLENNGWHNIVLTLRGAGEMEAQFQTAGIEVKTLNQTNVFSLRSIRQTAQAVNACQPDVVVTNLFRADFIGRLFFGSKVKAPIVSHIVTTYNHRRYFIARVFEWLTKYWSRGYIANSSAVKDFYVRSLGVNPAKIIVITNGLDAAVFQRADAHSIEQEFDLPKDRLVVVCVGNLAPNKGQADLITAFDQVFGSNPAAFLLLVGEGEQRSVLEAQRDQLPSKERIFLLGSRTDVPNILKASDIFAFPTHFEGMSTALLEAMAAGLAITTTNIPENKVILTENVTALMFPPKDAAALAETLRNLERDPALRQSLGKKAEESVQTTYSIQASAKRFAEQLGQYAQK